MLKNKFSLILLTVATTELVRRAVAHVAQHGEQHRHQAHKTDQKRAVQRWEDEGGAVVTPALPVPTQSAQAQAHAPRTEPQRTSPEPGRSVVEPLRPGLEPARTGPEPLRTTGLPSLTTP